MHICNEMCTRFKHDRILHIHIQLPYVGNKFMCIETHVPSEGSVYVFRVVYVKGDIDE